MTKYVISTDVPELTPSQMRIDPPTLLQEVHNCWGHRPANGMTGINWLRQIANEITKWDKDFMPFRHCIPSDYQGIPFSTPEEVAEIALRMVQDKYPKLTDKWIDHCIRSKTTPTKLIWFTGDQRQTTSFRLNYIDRIELSEVQEYMGKHAPKMPKVQPKTEESASSEIKLEENLDHLLNEAVEEPKPIKTTKANKK